MLGISILSPSTIFLLDVWIVLTMYFVFYDFLLDVRIVLTMYNKLSIQAVYIKFRIGKKKKAIVLNWTNMQVTLQLRNKMAIAITIDNVLDCSRN